MCWDGKSIFLHFGTALPTTNQTSLENGLQESYDAGVLQNLSEVLGDTVQSWFWPSPRTLDLRMIDRTASQESQMDDVTTDPYP